MSMTMMIFLMHPMISRSAMITQDDSNYAPDDIDGEEWKPTEDEASDDDSNCFRRFRLHPELANLDKDNFIFILDCQCHL